MVEKKGPTFSNYTISYTANLIPLVIGGLILRKLDESHLVVYELFKMVIQISISINNKAHDQNSSTCPNI